MISKNTIQKVNDASDIIDVVGSFVKLKKRGVNYLGNCPFHNEKTPSFTVSPSKSIYKCFGCGRAGNVITFLQEHEKLSYPEAITWLAKRYHIEIEETHVTDEVKEQMQVEESLRIVNQFASTYFHEQLLESEEGKLIGKSYFEERGFRLETIQKFQLGYCPEDKNHFPALAQTKGYQVDLLQKAGLVSNRNQHVQALYSGRVIFPIHNQSGKVLGFGARILKTSEKAPKYINTPENELYHKSKTLYGIYFARQAISKLDECFLVEGYTDVISLHQAGVENVVASSGTSLTEDQLRLIKRYTKVLTILYDGDAAGIKAALRGLDMAIEQGMQVQVVLLPQDHDPDSFIKANGADGFTNYVAENKKDIILFKLEVSLKDAQDDAVKKSQLINEIADTLSKINRLEDFTKQQDYIRRCAHLLHIDEAGLVSLVNKKIREQVVKQNYQLKDDATSLEQQAQPEIIHQQEEANQLLLTDFLQEKGLLRVLLEYGNKPFDEQLSVSEFIRYKIGDADFVHSQWQKLYKAYYTYYDKSLQYPDLHFFTYHDEEPIRKAAIEALYYPYELSENWEKEYNIITPSRDMIYIDDVRHTVNYFLLRKIKATYLLLLEELKDIQDLQEELVLQQTIFELKKNENDLLQAYKVVAVR
ncbi:MAG: DNA primase [Chitinophagaceae bacterium]